MHENLSVISPFTGCGYLLIAIAQPHFSQNFLTGVFPGVGFVAIALAGVGLGGGWIERVGFGTGWMTREAGAIWRAGTGICLAG